MKTELPAVACPYIPPDQCTDFTPAPCCERIKGDGDGDGDGNSDGGDDGGVDDGAGVIVKTSMALLLVLSALAALI